MSETVHYRGIIKEVELKENQSLEEYAQEVLKEKNYEKDSYYDSFLECLEQEFNEEYILHKEKLYKVVNKQELDAYDDLFSAHKKNDGTISFEVKYYNGGCGFKEAIGYAVDNMKDDEERNI